jgi:hypothetical protein
VLYRYRLPALAGSILLLLLSFASIAQDNDPWAGYGVEASFISGKVFRHTKKFAAPLPDRVSTIDVNLLQHTAGEKDWQQRRHYPTLGLGLTYTGYGIDSIYGQTIGLYPVLELPIIRGKHLEWTFKLGLGVGYSSKYYRRYPDWDTLNNAVASNFNNYTMFATDLRYKINNQWAVSLGGNFSHMSDGAWRWPNLGVNVYGAHVAVRYYPVTDKPKRIKRELQPLKNRLLVQGRLGFSFNEYHAPDGPQYPIYTASALVSKRYASRNKAFAGVDYSYHPGMAAFLKVNEIMPGEENAQSWKSALFFGNEFLMGRFGLVLQMGFYVKDTYLKANTHYQKIGYNFYLIQNEKGPLKELVIYSMLKTHIKFAEFIEFGFGASF